MGFRVALKPSYQVSRTDILIMVMTVSVILIIRHSSCMVTLYWVLLNVVYMVYLVESSFRPPERKCFYNLHFSDEKTESC